MADILSVIQTIAQVVRGKGYDGALDDKGKSVKIGLRREEEITIHDPRLIDGFRVKFSGDKMLLTYQAEIRLAEVSVAGFESKIKQILSDIYSFIKTEYRKLANKELNISKEGQPDIKVESISNVRAILKATQAFNLKNTSAGSIESEESTDEKLKKTMKKFLEFGKKSYPDALKPTNVSHRIKQ